MAIKFKQIEGNVDLSNYYTKEETQSIFSEEINMSLDSKLEDYYTKTEVDSMVGSGGSVKLYQHFIEYWYQDKSYEITVYNTLERPFESYQEFLNYIDQNGNYIFSFPLNVYRFGIHIGTGTYRCGFRWVYVDYITISEGGVEFIQENNPTPTQPPAGWGNNSFTDNVTPM